MDGGGNPCGGTQVAVRSPDQHRQECSQEKHPGCLALRLFPSVVRVRLSWPTSPSCSRASFPQTGSPASNRFGHRRPPHFPPFPMPQSCRASHCRPIRLRSTASILYRNPKTSRSRSGACPAIDWQQCVSGGPARTRCARVHDLESLTDAIRTSRRED